VVISNPLGSVTSQVAMLTVRIPAPRTILNVNFAAYSQVKVGFAGTGLTPSDYWNNYTAPWQQFAGLSDLITADGTPTTVGLTVQNGAGHWGMDHPDLMYNCYCYSQDNGDVILTVTNLPSGTYDFYLYGHGGAANANTVFQLLLGGADRGSRSTGTNADWALTNWVEGAQYVVYRNVSATNGGAPVTIKAHPGLSGYAQLNGMQIALVNRLPVGPVSGPTIGGNAFGKLSMQFPWKDPSRAYWIQASTNLLDWMTVGSSIADGDGTVSYTDPDSDKRPTRFYRVMPQ